MSVFKRNAKPTVMVIATQNNVILNVTCAVFISWRINCYEYQTGTRQDFNEKQTFFCTLNQHLDVSIYPHKLNVNLMCYVQPHSI